MMAIKLLEMLLTLIIQNHNFYIYIMYLYLFVVIAFLFFTSLFFVFINCIVYFTKGRIITRKKIWIPIQLWSVIIVPFFFLYFADLGETNDCCSGSAIFSPNHRIGIYILIILSAISYVFGLFKKDVRSPITEVFHNSLLILGLILNIIFCLHFNPFFIVLGNVPIILLYLIMLVENQKQLKLHIINNEYSANNLIQKYCLSIIKSKPIFKYPLLTILLIPIVILLSLFLILFGQKPDSIIRAFTDTYKHGFSQLDYMCENVDCGEHFLCSVGANGHRQIVKPIRYGERNGSKIICNRQLLVSNAFEELLQENFPKLQHLLRRKYNSLGNIIHKYYYIFNNKFVSDFVYILMKPLEFFFLLSLYTFDKKPENRIAVQYLNKIDRKKIKHK